MLEMTDVNEPHPVEALTFGVRNVGGMAGQDLRHMPHTWYRQKFDITITETGTTSAILSSEKLLSMDGQYVNYIILQPTIRGNPVVANIGSNSIDWTIVNGIVVPNGLRVNTVRLQTLPTRDNWQVAMCPYLSAPVAGYSDAWEVYFGYLPDGQPFVNGLDGV